MTRKNISCSKGQTKLMKGDDLLSLLSEPAPSLSTLVKEGRKRNNLKQNELAILTDLTTTEISRIESGQTKKPSVKVLKSLAPYIGLPFSQILLYAGYSGVDEDEIYYNKKGERIQYQSVVESIYKADPELLEMLQNIDEFSRSDIDLIRKTIEITAKIRYSNNQEFNVLNSILTSIKKFVHDQFDLMLQYISLH